MREYIKPDLMIIEFDVQDQTNLTVSANTTTNGTTYDWAGFWKN